MVVVQQAGPESTALGVGHLLTRALDPRLTERVTAERRALAALLTPLRRGSTLAVVGVQPGAGRTTVAGLLAHLLAVFGGTRVLAIDCDTRHRGDDGHPELRQRLGTGPAGALHAVFAGLRLEPPRGVRLPPGPPGFRWMSQHLAHPAGHAGPDLLAAAGTERGRSFPAAHYAAAASRFGRWYRAIVTDTPAGPSADVLPGVLRRANRILAVGSADETGLGGLRATLDWLTSVPARDVPGDVLGLTSCVLVARPGDPRLRPDQARTALRRPVHVLPADAHLAAQLPLDWTLLGERTRRAALALAADAVAGLGEPVGKKISAERNRSGVGSL